MAGGRGIRFQPYSRTKPKPLFKIAGESLLIRNIRQLTNVFDFEEVFVITGYGHERIETELREIKSECSVTAIKIPESKIDRGLIVGYEFIRNFIDEGERFICCLADEYYDEADQRAFSNFVQNNNAKVICTFKRFSSATEYFKNYSVEVSGDTGFLTKFNEKPTQITSPYFGLGLIAANGDLVKRTSEFLDNIEVLKSVDY